MNDIRIQVSQCNQRNYSPQGWNRITTTTAKHLGQGLDKDDNMKMMMMMTLIKQKIKITNRPDN